jgi:hypothetical protein
MVAMFSGLLVGVLGLTAAYAQEAQDDPTMTPYESAEPADTQATEQDPQQTPSTTTTVVEPPAPVIVQPPAQPAAPAPVVVEERPVNVTVLEDPKPRRNMSLSLGGGVSDFTDSTVRDRTDISGAYEARLGIGMSSLFGIEAAYVGTAGSIDTLGLDDDAVLISNGLEGLARLNLGTFDVQPYVVGGASWVRYNVVNDSFNTSDVRDSDDVLAIPFGGGISTYLGNTGLMADARFTFRATFDEDLIRPTPSNSDGSSLSNWMATVRLGYTF